MIGWEDLTAITASYRHQWTGMPGNPITFMLNFRHFDEKRNMAFGGGLTHDQNRTDFFYRTQPSLCLPSQIWFGEKKAGK